MIAKSTFNDLNGTAGADFQRKFTLSDELASFFNIDTNKYIIVGISIGGTKKFVVQFICIDIEKSTDEKKHIIMVRIDDNKENILSMLFSELRINLYVRNYDEYSELDYDKEITLNQLKDY